MYIYGAQIQAAPGKGAAAAAKVTEIRDVMTAEVGQQFWSWGVVAGAPLGSFVMSTRVEGTAALREMQMKLAASETYQNLAAGVSDLWAAPPETNFNQVVAVAGAVGESPAPVISITQATIAGGNMSEAMAWSGKLLEHASNVTGAGAMLTVSAVGNPFDVGWMLGFESGEASDAASQAIQADADYTALLDEGTGLFIDGSAQRVTMMQLP
jgi:hypothetical protein